MKAGFAKSDITPPVGGELSGFGPFIGRRSVDVREKLWARAMAIECDGTTMMIISCDIIGVIYSITQKVRKLVSEKTGIPEDAIVIFSSHTHSGPNPTELNGWGECDPAYSEVLPYRIGKSCVQAFGNMKEVEVSYIETGCEGIGVNREYEDKKWTIDQALSDEWRPEKPEMTDTTCHVLAFRNGDKLLGFISSFGCHPVVCCEDTHSIHGDFCGVATNILELENSGSVGLFIQGAHGDVDTCVAHQSEQDSFKALDVIASRYAEAVRAGINNAPVIEVDKISYCSDKKIFSRKQYGVEQMEGLLAQCTGKFSVDASEEDLTGHEARSNIVMVITLRKLIAQVKAGQPLALPAELYGFRIGPVRFLGSGFETFQTIKNEVKEKSGKDKIIIASLTNDGLGYAIDNTTAAKGGYAAEFAPFILGTLPYANIHEELVEALLKVDKMLDEA